MYGQILRTTDAGPTIELEFFSLTDGSPTTTLTNATAGLTIGYRRGITAVTTVTLAAQTSTGAYVSGGFVHLGGGTYRLDLPIAANATGVTDVTILATALPATIAMNAIVVALTPDDLTAATVTDASISAAVDAALLDNFAALPSAAAIATAVAAPSAATIATTVWAATTRELTTVSAAIREAIADSFLGRSIAGAANGGRTLTSALRAVRNRVTRSGATFTVYAEDDTTVAYTASITTDTNAAPITGIDPT